MYRVDFYIYKISTKDFKLNEYEIIHSVLVNKEAEAKFLCEAFKGSLTKAEYKEVEE